MINILNEPKLIFNTFRWFLLFLSNTNAQLNVKTVLFQTIQFRISTQFPVYTQLVICLNTVFCLHTVK